MDFLLVAARTPSRDPAIGTTRRVFAMGPSPILNSLPTSSSGAKIIEFVSLRAAGRVGADSASPALVGGALSGDDRHVGIGVGRVRPVPRVPRRAAPDRLHDERD